MRHLALPWLALLGSMALSGCGTGPYVRDYRTDQNCRSTQSMVDGVLTETRRTCTDTRVYRVDDYVSGPGAERRVRETCRRVWELSGGQMRLVREQCDQTERTQTPREYRTHRQSYRSGRQERCTLSLKKWFRCSSDEEGDVYAIDSDTAA